MRIRMVGGTDIGKRRKNNQDSIYFDEPQGIAIVADGIGGRKGGGVASSMMVDGLKQAFLESDRIRHEEIMTFVTSAIDRLNRKVIDEGRRSEENEGMGTTLNFLMFVGDKLYLAHVGDSRTYYYYKGNMWQLTIDHNVSTFIERGWLPPSALHEQSKGAALVRSIGISERCEMDLYEVNLKPGAMILSCSDGLSGMVTDSKIRDILSAHEKKLDLLPTALINEANKNGGKDNVTVFVAQVKDT